MFHWRAERLPSRRIPQADGPVIRPRQDAAFSPVEASVSDRAVMLHRRTARLPGYRIPEADGSVIRPRQNAASRTVEDSAFDRAVMLHRRAERLPGRRIPQPDSSVIRPRQDAVFSLIKRSAAGPHVFANEPTVVLAIMIHLRAQRLSGRYIPQADTVVRPR